MGERLVPPGEECLRTGLLWLRRVFERKGRREKMAEEDWEELLRERNAEVEKRPRVERETKNIMNEVAWERRRGEGREQEGVSGGDREKVQKGHEGES